MNALVIYATRTGNTRRVAEAMAEALRARGLVVTLHDVAEAPGLLPQDTDLLLIGGPTEGHGMTPPMASYLQRLDRTGLRNVMAAAFDTRLWWPRILSGSAAASIARTLRDKGARVVDDEMSFIVSMKPELVAGEIERAADWARGLAEGVDRRLQVSATP
jgi:flavodoxin